MQSEHELTQALKQCPRPDFMCRLGNISRFGISGLKESFGQSPVYAPDKPGPSWSTIEKVMMAILSALAKAIPAFKTPTQVVKIVYKPHFKMLDMFDETFARYWGSLDFVRWVLEVLNELEKSVRTYIFLTGQFDYRAYITYLSRFQGRELGRAVEEIRVTGAILVDFDQLMLHDMKELLKAMNDGLDQVIKLEKGKSDSDTIALGTLHESLQFMFLKVDDKLNPTWDSLVKHMRSWKLDEGELVIPPFHGEVGSLRTKLKTIIDSVGRLY